MKSRGEKRRGECGCFNERQQIVLRSLSLCCLRFSAWNSRRQFRICSRAFRCQGVWIVNGHQLQRKESKLKARE